MENDIIRDNESCRLQSVMIAPNSSSVSLHTGTSSSKVFDPSYLDTTRNVSNLRLFGVDVVALLRVQYFLSRSKTVLQSNASGLDTKPIEDPICCDSNPSLISRTIFILGLTTCTAKRVNPTGSPPRVRVLISDQAQVYLAMLYR